MLRVRILLRARCTTLFDQVCLFRGPSIDASYQVSVHLAKRFQIRNKKGEKLTDHGCQVLAKTHVAFGLVWFYGV
jgi:hypothetical protein